MRDICYVDTETTSLIDPHIKGGRRVWEVAIIRVSAEGGAVQHPLCAWLQITDVDLDDHDPESLRIGRFAERFHPEAYGPVGPVAELPGRDRPIMLWGTTEENAAATILELTHDAVLAGSRPEFDAANFADILRRHGAASRVLPWYHHPLDIANEALGYLRATEPGQWSGSSYPTAALSEACGVPVPADRHSAWADAAWCYRWDEHLRSPRPKAPGSRILPV